MIRTSRVAGYGFQTKRLLQKMIRLFYQRRITNDFFLSDIKLSNLVFHHVSRRPVIESENENIYFRRTH